MHTRWIDGRFTKKRIEFAHDLGSEVGGVGIEFGESHLLVDGDIGMGEPDGRDVFRRQSDLGSFDDLEEGKTLVLLNERFESIKGRGIFGQAR